MHALYTDLAKVYEAMYQTFINYPEEYRFYSSILHKYGTKQVLEIGSGTGNLAKLLIDNAFAYAGLDMSSEMIAIAQSKLPNAQFTQADMRDFKLPKPVQSALITGRTISYLHSNQDVNAALKSIHQNLSPNGILCFDFIDASEFIPAIAAGVKVQHHATYANIHYRRESDWKLELSKGMAFEWAATYYQQKQNEWTEIGKDQSIVRTFSKEEIRIFLKINQFEVLEFIPKTAYAFPTYIVVAKKG